MRIIGCIQLLIGLVGTVGCFAQVYPAMEPSDNRPSVFAAGLVSDGLNNRDFCISPDGNHIFYTVQQKDFTISTILHLEKRKGKWSKPQVAPFSGKFNDLEAVFSPDGTKVFFSSNRPTSSSDSTNDFDLWYLNKTTSGWGEPIHLGFDVNSSQNEFYPSVARNGNLYFTTELKDGKGKEDIFCSEWKNGNFLAPVRLSEAINSNGYEFNAFVDPDEKYIIFTGYGRKDDLGKGDLYISKKDADGNWLPAKNLGPSINSKALDYCPFVSWDKKYLFFSSNRIVNRTPFVQATKYKQLESMLKGPGNGGDDVYWVRFGY